MLVVVMLVCWGSAQVAQQDFDENSPPPSPHGLFHSNGFPDGSPADTGASVGGTHTHKPIKFPPNFEHIAQTFIPN